MEALAVQLRAWSTTSSEQELEKELLLKELCVGRRAVDLPVWAGNISTPAIGSKESLFLVPISVLVSDNDQPVVLKVDRNNVDLSEQSDALA